MAMRSHQSLILESVAIQDRLEKHYEVRRLLCTPIFHAFTSPLVLLNALRYRETTYVMERYNNTFASKVLEFGITETAMPPALFVAILASPPGELSMLRSLRLIWTGGAVLAPELKRQTLEVIPDARIVSVFGMTECGWLTTFAYPEVDDTNAVGRPLPGYQIK